MRQRHLQMLLAPAHDAEVRNLPVQPGQAQQAFDHASRLAKREPVQVLTHQAELDGCIRERWRATALTTGGTSPLHFLVDPQQQRAALAQGIVVGRPVGRAVLRLRRLAHPVSLSAARW